jgi:hypothetical protein
MTAITTDPTSAPKRAEGLPLFLGLAASAVAFVTLIGPPCASFGAENTEISARRMTERKAFSDTEIMNGFFKIAFGAELQMTSRTDRVRKYEAPVRVYVDDRSKPDRRAEVAAVVADIRARVKDLDIEITADRNLANVKVTLVRDRDLTRTIRSFYGRQRAGQIQRSLNPQCLSGFRKDESYRIIASDVIIVADAGDFVFHDCAYEELLQALGPINDDASVPWTMFNDDVQMGFFDIYDQYLLNILYDLRVRPGMTANEVRAVLPEVLPAVRTWIADINGLSQEWTQPNLEAFDTSRTAALSRINPPSATAKGGKPCLFSTFQSWKRRSSSFGTAFGRNLEKNGRTRY